MRCREKRRSKGFPWLLRAPLTVVESARLVERALALATALAHPVYDCVYLSLAAEVAAPVVTADKRLQTAAARDPDPGRLVVALGSIAPE